MCSIDLDVATVWDVNRQKTRKPRRCQSCGSVIQTGTHYVALFTVVDGEASRESSCVECWADNEAFGNAPGHMMTVPSYFPTLLFECVEVRLVEDEAAPDGVREEYEGEWADMAKRVSARQNTARAGGK